MKPRHLAFVLICASVAACASDKAEDSAIAGASEASKAEESSDGGGGMVGEVTIANGPDAGTYKYQSKVGCIDYAAMGLGIGGMGDTVISKLLRLGFSTTTGTKSGTIDDFELNFAVDREKGMAEDYKIEPKKGRGTGTASISGSAPEYAVVVDGKTAEGVGVRSTIRCLK